MEQEALVLFLSSKVPYVAYQQDNKFGFLNIDVPNNEIVLHGEFISNKGKVLYEFEIRNGYKWRLSNLLLIANVIFIFNFTL